MKNGRNLVNNFLDMNFFIVIILGLLPSSIWLLFFLRKDVHPEPKSMILKVFFLGALVAPIAAMDETGFQNLLIDLKFDLSSTKFFLLYWFLGVGLVEEILKYLVVRFAVLSHHEFDEPVDAMLYMVISGLGFAALENVLVVISQTILNQPFSETMYLVIYRFLTATFLHALCSALIGYFLALSICHTNNQFRFISIGLGLAAFFHGLYDICSTKIYQILDNMNRNSVVLNSNSLIVFSIIFFAILICLAIFVIYGFKKLKKMQSVCKI